MDDNRFGPSLPTSRAWTGFNDGLTKRMNIVFRPQRGAPRQLAATGRPDDVLIHRMDQDVEWLCEEGGPEVPDEPGMLE